MGVRILPIRNSLSLLIHDVSFEEMSFTIERQFD